MYYLDNLCITTLQPDLSSYPSEFMTWNEPDADEYVYATIIWRIKGTGQQYPLQPGQSVIIASIAANHQQINADGGPTVDLTSAEFEGWIPSMSGLVSDNPKSINMELYMGTSGQYRRRLVHHRVRLLLRTVQIGRRGITVRPGHPDRKNP